MTTANTLHPTDPKIARRERGTVLASQLVRDLASTAVAKIRASQYVSSQRKKPRPTVTDRALLTKARQANRDLKKWMKALNSRGWGASAPYKQLYEVHQHNYDKHRAEFDQQKQQRIAAVQALKTDLLIKLIDADPKAAGKLCREFQRRVETI